MKKALIAMSGGVDSSVAAKIMSDRGYRCMGCTMKLYSGTEERQPADSCQTAAEGTHDELLKSCLEYKKLYDAEIEK